MKPERRLSVGVLGAGLIGVDLAVKVVRSDCLDLRLVAGRTAESSGLQQAARLGLPTASHGIRSLVELEEPLDVVFDASNAIFHAEHAEALAPLGTVLVDLTPSRIGRMVVPTVNGADILEEQLGQPGSRHRISSSKSKRSTFAAPRLAVAALVLEALRSQR
ncbi:hypothetical protein ACFYP0_25360 [Micromonospora arida]|uniref:hypothetical protein n=1 Tax=Micromonospora arida TaxID=2203715 RepID=UPI0036816D0F